MLRRCPTVPMELGRRLMASVNIFLLLAFPSGSFADEVSGGDVSFATVSRGIISGIVDRSLLAIRTPEEWQQLWQRHSTTLAPPPAMPVIDFSREMVIAVFLGSRRTGGFGIEILRVERKGEKLQVFYREVSPPVGAMVPQVLTQPYHMIQLPRVDGEIVFQRQGE